ncbi:MAG: hypothetical protein M1600_06415 [Firmicutes bacterium]|jgi:hypothetical protein|nr:hypothetical protein [Bacillota bacterium]
MNSVKLGPADRWERMGFVFAWAYDWHNVGGWVVEHRGEDRDSRANTSEKRTHVRWRLGSWGLKAYATSLSNVFVMVYQKKLGMTQSPIRTARGDPRA